MTLIRPAVRGTPGLAILALACASRGCGSREPARNRDARGQGRELFLREWMPDDSTEPRRRRARPRSTTSPPASPATTWAAPAAPGRRQERGHPDLIRPRVVHGHRCGSSSTSYHPGFRTSSSVLLHRFGTDPGVRSLAVRGPGGLNSPHGRCRGSGGDETDPRVMGLEVHRRPDGLQPAPPRPRVERGGEGRDVPVGEWRPSTRRNPPAAVRRRADRFHTHDSPRSGGRASRTPSSGIQGPARAARKTGRSAGSGGRRRLPR